MSVENVFVVVDIKTLKGRYIIYFTLILYWVTGGCGPWTVDDLRVELEIKIQLDKDVPRSPVIEVGVARDTSTNSSAASSMTEFREVKSTADNLRVELRSKAILTEMCLILTSLRWGKREIRVLPVQLQPQWLSSERSSQKMMIFSTRSHGDLRRLHCHSHAGTRGG